MKKIIGWSISLNAFLLTGFFSLLFAENTTDELVFTSLGVVFIVMELLSFVFLVINMYKKEKLG